MESVMAEIESPLAYKDAVQTIKRAILESQSRAVKMVSGEQLSLYFGIGLYVSAHSREGYWGTGAIDAICEQLQKELPGLRGFSPESVRKMRSFAEFWSQFINRSSVTTKLQPSDNEQPIESDALTLQKWSPVTTEINRDEFLGISFTHHMTILNKTKDINEVLFYIHEAVTHSWSTRKLRDALNLSLYKEGQESLPNNFTATMPSSRSALQAIRMFKDEYLLDFINVEDIDETYGTVDERIVENQIVANVCRFMMTFGRDFTFVSNQYHLEVYGVEHFPDLLFFNRELNALVVMELKIGKFKPSYLGQLHQYLQILDDKVRKPHENQAIGIVLCKEADRSYVEYAVRDYSKPMGVVTYKTFQDMPEEYRNALPNPEELKKLL